MTKKEIIKTLKAAAKGYPKTYSDKVYDAVTIDEGIMEVERFGIREGLELAIKLISLRADKESKA